MTVKIGTEGATLSFSIERRERGEVEFLTRYSDSHFGGQIVSSDYMSGSPAELFRAMATEWRGWEGEKGWEDLEGRLKLRAVIDSLGHVNLSVEMTRYSPLGKLAGEVNIDAGQLEDIAIEMEALFNPPFAPAP
ncbi:MAG: DUF6228 family protein [Devosia sp.]